MEKNLKIAMLGHKRIPSRESGIKIVEEELSTRMVQLGHEVTCYNRRGHYVSGKEFDINAVNNYKGIKLSTVITIDKKGLSAMSSSFLMQLKLFLVLMTLFDFILRDYVKCYGYLNY